MRTSRPYRWTVSIAVSLVFAASFLLLFTPLGEPPLTALFAVGDVETVDFADLKLTDKPNQFLICPPDYCGADPQAESPTLDLPVEGLRERWQLVLAGQPRVELLAGNSESWQYDYIARSARFRFPDIITVRFIPISSSRSTLAIYSRSIYGRSDFGVNRERIEAWLRLLGEGP